MTQPTLSHILKVFGTDARIANVDGHEILVDCETGLTACVTDLPHGVTAAAEGHVLEIAEWKTGANCSFYPTHKERV